MADTRTAEARAEAAFEPAAADAKPPTGADEYKVRAVAERAKTAKPRALRLAAGAKAGVKRKAAPGGRGKRP
jgi:hypothetical protein